LGDSGHHNGVPGISGDDERKEMLQEVPAVMGSCRVNAGYEGSGDGECGPEEEARAGLGDVNSLSWRIEVSAS